MTQPFDLGALELEQNLAPFDFVFDEAGDVFTIDAKGIDMRVSRALARGDFDGALALLLGAEEWERLLDLRASRGGGPFQLEHAIALVNGYAAHLGTTVGKSRASSRSSKRTGMPSKRTSSSTSRRGSQK